jgi:phosphatidylglycerol:prolipoprotein diacylglycerol transferase
MYPILLRTNYLTIYSFGLLVILGIIIGVLILWILAKKLDLKLPGGRLFDYTIYVLLAGMIGARLFYILFNWIYFKNNPIQIITSWTSGLSIYGGLIFGLLTAFLLLRNDKNRLRWLDIGFISMMFGLAFGMIGCFLSGSYYGSPSNLTWTVTYTKLESFASDVLNRAVHPVQIYEVLVVLLIGFILLLLVLRKKSSLPAGFALLLGLISYAIWRIIADYFFIGKPQLIGTLRIDVLISILIIIVSSVGLVYLTKRKKTA